jgi:hypothetical protein
MNYQQRNRALSEFIRERCERTGCNPIMSSEHNANFSPDLYFNVQSLFFGYGPLCMSLHDAVADDSCSDSLKKVLGSQFDPLTVKDNRSIVTVHSVQHEK